jgi:hypothetical protein
MEPPEKVSITQKDIMKTMDIFTRVPPILLKMVVSLNSNVVKKFQSQIEDYKKDLSPKDLEKLKLVTEMPVEELQKILSRAYLETQEEQLKILADPHAQPFITTNLQELEKLII